MDKIPYSNENNKRKKKLICVILLLIFAGIIMSLALKFSDKLFAVGFVKSQATAGRLDITFADADYTEDIFTDEEYLDKNRYIEYVEGAISTVIYSDHAMYGVGPEFFNRYFNAVINGDSEALNQLFTDKWISANGSYGIFTMQKIYNIIVERLYEEVIENSDGSTTIKYYFKVSYMIKDNNGTFRYDLESDAALPLIFELIDSGDELKINDIFR